MGTYREELATPGSKPGDQLQEPVVPGSGAAQGSGQVPGGSGGRTTAALPRELPRYDPPPGRMGPSPALRARMSAGNYHRREKDSFGALWGPASNLTESYAKHGNRLFGVEGASTDAPSTPNSVVC